MTSSRAPTPLGRPPPATSRLKPGGRSNRKEFIFSNPTKEDLLAARGKEPGVRTPVEAIRTLGMHGLDLNEDNLDMSTLITALLEFALSGPNVTPLATEVLSALALAMEKVQGTSPPRPQEPPPIEEQLRKMERSSEHYGQQIEKFSRLFEETQTTLNNSIDELKKYANQTESALQTLTRTNTTPPAPAPPSSYAAVARSGLNRHQEEIVARSEAKLREVALVCDGAGLTNLTPKELVAKANIALSALHEVEDYQETMECFSARSVRDRILILEMDSRESADWVKRKNNKARFISKFGANFTLLDTPFRTIAEFVPVTLDINVPTTVTRVERGSGLPAESIRKIAWVKRPDLRKKNQRVAHAIISFSSAEAANQAIRRGINVEGKKVTVHRTQPEPTRCYKCQQIGDHFASHCPSDEETCGTCGEHNHSTKDCDTTDSEDRFCVNCKVKGHASWDRECESFVAARERLLRRNKEANLKYFPTPDDPTTWQPETEMTTFPPSLPPSQANTTTPHAADPEPYSEETIRMRTSEQNRLQQIARNACTPSSWLPLKPPPRAPAPTRPKKKRPPLPRALPNDQQQLDRFITTSSRPPTPSLSCLEPDEDTPDNFFTPGKDPIEDSPSYST